MDMVSTTGQMDMCIKENGKIICLKDRESTHGKVERNTLDNGKLTLWMVMGNWFIKKGQYIKEPF